jgi:hypothetical protein
VGLAALELTGHMLFQMIFQQLGVKTLQGFLDGPGLDDNIHAVLVALQHFFQTPQLPLQAVQPMAQLAMILMLHINLPAFPQLVRQRPPLADEVGGRESIIEFIIYS